MDKYEFNIKVEQIKKMVNRGDYATAMKIADAIDWHRVRNASLLSTIAQIYEKNEEYGKAKDVLLLAFERAPNGKRLLYKLTDLALKEGSIPEAEAYYREFCEIAQEDSRQYLLRYLILKAKRAPVDQLIRALETYTSKEVDEKWMYELAALYHRAGQKERCVSMCDTIILLFGVGKYVEKAMVLKQEYAPLNNYQRELVENRSQYEASIRTAGEQYSNPPSRRQMIYQEQPEEHPMMRQSVDSEVVLQLREEVETEKLAQEVTKLAEQAQAAVIEEDRMEATRMLDDLRSIKDIKPTQRVLDAAAEREAAEREAAELEHELARQRAAIRAAKEREELEAAALRRAEEEREAARREEEERRAKKQAEIDRERALQQKSRMVAVEEANEAEFSGEEPDMNHLMIEAENEEDGLSLALEALKKIHLELGRKNQVAKINSGRLNLRGILAVKEKLAGKDLVIEHAAGLTATVQQELDVLMGNDTTGMIVVLIDTPENLKALHIHNPSLAGKFQYIGARETAVDIEEAVQKETETQEQIARDVIQEQTEAMDIPDRPMMEKYQRDLADEYPEHEQSEPSEEEGETRYGYEPAMSADEFARFACKYASEIDCSITGKSMLALYERIEMMEEDGVLLTERAAIDLIEEAADKAEKQSLGRKLTSLIAPPYDKDGFLILREKDFFD